MDTTSTFKSRAPKLTTTQTQSKIIRVNTTLARKLSITNKIKRVGICDASTIDLNICIILLVYAKNCRFVVFIKRAVY
jgi:hypothetical protein